MEMSNEQAEVLRLQIQATQTLDQIKKASYAEGYTTGYNKGYNDGYGLSGQPDETWGFILVGVFLGAIITLGISSFLPL